MSEAGGAFPTANTSEENGEISCSIEETNRIRAQLGLKPLRVQPEQFTRKGSAKVRRVGLFRSVRALVVGSCVAGCLCRLVEVCLLPPGCDRGGPSGAGEEEGGGSTARENLHYAREAAA